MKVIFALLLLAISYNATNLRECGNSCKLGQQIDGCFAVKQPSCTPNDVAPNVGNFALYFKEKYNEYDIDAKKFKKTVRKLKEEYNDLYNYLYSMAEEQNEYYENIKKSGKSYLKEIEKTFNDGQSGYSELTEITEEFSHVIKSGKNYSKEVEISGDGFAGRLMALTATIDDDPAFVGKLLTENPTNANRALLLFNPSCNRRCGNNMIGLYSLWHGFYNKCWAYFLRRKLRKKRCGRRKFLMKKYLRRLCRPYGPRLTRDFLRYWNHLFGSSICNW